MTIPEPSKLKLDKDIFGKRLPEGLIPQRKDLYPRFTDAAMKQYGISQKKA